MSSTPYDDVFRTLSNDCRKLLLPVLNEIFHENYNGTEKITFLQNEHFINKQDGVEEKRITDNCFDVESDRVRKYHLECESTKDNSILVRIFEYDAQIALDDGVLTSEKFTVTFPNSAILFLRSGKHTADTMMISIRTSTGEISYPVETLQMQKYSLESILEKNLLFLIPFYIFNHESKLAEYDKNPDNLAYLLDRFRIIRQSLEKLCETGKINEFTKCTIIEMTDKVVRNLTKKYKNVTEGVKSVMGGVVLDYEAKRIRNEGIAEGIAEGIETGRREGRQEGILQGRNEGRREGERIGETEISIRYVRQGLIDAATAAEQLGMSKEEFEKLLVE